VAKLAQQAGHPYAYTGAALADGLALLSRVVDIAPGPFTMVTGLGTLRAVDVEAGSTIHNLSKLDKALIVGIQGWRDFYAKLIADNLNAAGYHAAHTEITLPHMGGNFDNWSLDYANWLDTHDGAHAIAQQVKHKLDGATCVGLPAVLGFLPETRAKITELLGVPLFEIPTLPPSVPGTRLFRALKTALMERGARLTMGPRVASLALEGERVKGVNIETAAHGRPRTIYGDAVILATGGLYGGGLECDYAGYITETVHGIPVANVPKAGEGYTADFLSSQPQPMHYVGVATDKQLRPLDTNGNPVAANLFAAGRLLAGYSPVVEGSSEGVDIATATFAVQQALGVVEKIGV
jgi:glycerol-3-phosphate dehydrogenase subunit B